MNAEILLFDGFEELDAMGPWQVLARLAGVSDDLTARLVTLEGPRPVEAHRGAVICAHGALSQRPDASVCTGALLLARSGILDGRRATTNPGALDDLRAHGGIEVLEARVVDDGDVLTAGAPACGLDLALRLLERADGPELAEAAARTLGYERPAVEVG